MLTAVIHLKIIQKWFYWSLHLESIKSLWTQLVESEQNIRRKFAILKNRSFIEQYSNFPEDPDHNQTYWNQSENYQIGICNWKTLKVLEKNFYDLKKYKILDLIQPQTMLGNESSIFWYSKVPKDANPKLNTTRLVKNQQIGISY